MKYFHTLYKKTGIKWLPDLLNKETHPVNKYFSICVFYIEQNSYWGWYDENVCHSNVFGLVDAFSHVNLHINCHHVCLCCHIWYFTGKGEDNNFLCLVFIDSVNVVCLYIFFFLTLVQVPFKFRRYWEGRLIKTLGVLLNSYGNFKREQYLLILIIKFLKST